MSRKKRKARRKGLLRGGIKGAAKGFMVGGISGAIAGGAIGAAGGAKAGTAGYKAKKEADKQDKANLEQAYGIYGEAYAGYSDRREQVDTDYQSSMSSARAAMAASGARLEGVSWETITGGIARERDESLSTIEADETAFRAGTAYGMVKEDFERMTGSGIGSRTGESFLTDKQRGMIRPDQDYGDIKPSFDEYEKYRFGTAEDKAAFSDSMTARIEASNLKYDRGAQMRSVNDASRTEFLRGGNN